MAIKLFLVLCLLPDLLSTNHVCENVITQIQITSANQRQIANTKSKRSLQNIRIHRHYDDSFTRVAANEELRVKVVEPAIRFWEQALQVKNPMSSPLFFDRECKDSYYYSFSSTRNRTKICKEQCETVQKCHTTVIPDKFLSKCYTSNADGIYESTGENGSGAPNSDLVVIITFLPDSCTTTTLAYATACYLEHILDRPVLGLINLCPDKILTGINLHTSISTLKHEIIHILGFSPTLFPFFRDKDGNPLTPRDDSGLPNLGIKPLEGFPFYQWSNETIIEKAVPVTYRTGTETKSVFVLVTPNIKKEAREHFNCSTLDGVYLEDNGSIQNILSHFEKKIFQNELMTPSISIQAVVSRFTMAFLQDTGWYEVDYSKAEKYVFAKNAGCDYVTKTCFEYINSKLSRNQSVYPYCNELITESGLKCATNLRSIEYCNLYRSLKFNVPLKYRYFADLNDVSTDPFSEYCPYQLEFVQTDQQTLIHNGICTDSHNNVIKNTKYDFFTEGFGPKSACMTFDKSDKWYFKSCGKKVYPSISGAGCYTYKCSKNDRLVIEVNGFDYQCRSDGQVIDVTSRAMYMIPFGKLVCPRCSSLCNSTVCDSYQNVLPVACNSVNRPCPDIALHTIPCSSAILGISMLYVFLFSFFIFLRYFIKSIDL